MSSEKIDSKVVEMRFDNQQFETHVKETISTLDKLKEKLNLPNSSDGIDKIGKSIKDVSFDSMERGLDSVGSKFKVMETIAVGALLRVGETIENSLVRTIKSISIDQVTAGWQKYADKTTSIQTIMAATGQTIDEVNKQMEKLNWFSDETSYNFTEMTSTIGKFTSNGVKLEDAVQAVQGISTWAAVAGQNAQTASRAYYNLAQAIGVGAVKYTDWKSIELANMATKEFKQQVIDTALAVGTLTNKYGQVQTAANGTAVTIENFSSTLRDNWFNTEVLTNVLGQYGKFSDMLNALYQKTGMLASDMIRAARSLKDGTSDWMNYIEDSGLSQEAFRVEIEKLAEALDTVGGKAFLAAQEAKTFSDAIDAAKDAASTAWMNFFETIFGNYEEAKVTWTNLANDLYDIFVPGVQNLTDLFKDAFDPPQKRLERMLRTGETDLSRFYDALSNATTVDGFVATIDSLVGGLESTNGATRSASQSLEYFNDIVTRVIRGEFGNGADRVEKLTAAGYDYATVQGMVNQVLYTGALTLGDLTDAQIENLDITEEEREALLKLKEDALTAHTPIRDLIMDLRAPTGRENFIQGIRNIILSILGVIEAIRDAWADVFPPEETSRRIFEITRSFQHFTKKIHDVITGSDRLKRSFRGLFALLDIIGSIVKGVIKVGFNFFAKILRIVADNALDVTSNLGDFLVKLRDTIEESGVISAIFETISKVLNRLASVFSAIVKPIATFVAGLFKVEKVGDIFKNLKTRIDEASSGIQTFVSVKDREKIELVLKTIKDLVVAIKDWLVQMWQLPAVQAVVTTFKDAFVKGFDKIKEIVTTVKDEIFEFFEKVNEKTEEGTPILQAFAQTIQEEWEKILEKFKGSFSISDIFKDENGDNVIKKFFKKLFPSFDQLEQTVGDATDSVTGFMTSLNLSETFKTKPMELIAKVIGKLSEVLNKAGLDTESIGAWVAFFGSFITFNKLASTLKATASAFDFLNSFGIAAKNFSVAAKSWAQNNSFAKIGKAVLEMGLAIVAVAGAMMMISKIPNEDFLKAAGGLVIATGALVGLAIAMGQFMKGPWFSSKKLFGVAATLISFGGALSLAALGFKIVADSTEGINWKSVLAFVGIAATLFGAMIGMSHLTGAKLNLGAITSMISFALAMKTLASAFKDLASMQIDDWESTLQRVAAVIVLFGSILAIAHGIGLGGSLAIAAIPLALYAFVKALQLVTEIDISKLGQSWGDLALLVGTLALIILGLSKLAHTSKNAGSALIGVGVSLLAIVTALKMLTKLTDDAGSLAGATVVVIALMVAIRGIIKALSKIKEGEILKAGLAMIAIAGAIGILTAAVGILAIVKPDDLGNATLVVMAIMAMMAFLIKATKNAATVYTNVISLGIVIAALAGVVVLLSQIKAEDGKVGVEAATLCLMGIMAMMSLLLKVADKTQEASSALWSVTAVIVAIGLMLMGLASYDPTNVLAAAASMALGIGSISMIFTAVAILSKVNREALFNGLVNAGIVLLAIVGVFAIIAIAAHALDAVLGGNVLRSFFDSMVEIGNGMGRVVGAFTGGLLEGFSESLPVIANNLATFMENLQPFLEKISGIQEGSLDGAKTLAEIILYICAADVLDALTSWLTGTGDLSTFGDKLNSISVGIASWYWNTYRLNFGVLEQSAAAAEQLFGALATIPKSGGLMGALLGNQDFSGFATGIANLGTGIKDFFNNLGDTSIDEGKVSSAANAGKMLAELQSALGPTGGEWQRIFGEKDLTGFSVGIACFGTGMHNFINAIQSDSFDQGKLDTVVNFAKSLAEVQNTLAPDGGMWQDFWGSSSLSTFGGNIESFGESLRKYGESVRSIPITQIQSVNMALQKLVEIFKIADDFSSNTFYGFSTALQSIANTSIQSFLDSFENSESTVKEAAQSMMDKFIQGAKSKDAEVEDTATNLMDTFNTTVESYDQIIQATTDTLMGNMVSAIVDYASSFSRSAKTVFTSFLEGAESKKPEIEEKGRSLISAMQTAVLGYKDLFYSAGNNLVEGFKNGITDNTFKAEAAARAMALASLRAAQRALDERSPSKAFAQVGEYAVLGYTNKFFEMETKAREAGETMANASLYGTHNVIQRVSEEIQNNIDAQPTIRPVLDLTEINNGMGTLNSMLGTNKALTVSGLMSGIRPAYAMASAGGVTNNTPTFNIYQQPGENAEDLARRINKIMGGWYK